MTVYMYMNNLYIQYVCVCVFLWICVRVCECMFLRGYPCGEIRVRDKRWGDRDLGMRVR